MIPCRDRDPTPLPRTVEQGGFDLSDDPRAELRALLGSCVAICLHDPEARLGGMTHTVWTHTGRLGSALPLYEYERLYNEMAKRGARRDRLRASVVGGAALLGGRRRHGLDLGRVTLDMLIHEGVAVDEVALGGPRARQVRFLPATGDLRIEAVDTAPPERRGGPPIVPGVELF